MISTPDRERAVRLIKETTDAGARTFRACFFIERHDAYGCFMAICCIYSNS